MSGDMASTIVPKSDQLNADDLIAGERTIKIRDVVIRPNGEQRVWIYFDGDDGKPYKACKSMCRVMVTVWGADSKAYVGRSMTLYRDPSVPWGGLAVGGIRISHMSDIDSKVTIVLTMSKQSKKPFTVKPLEASGTKTAAPQSEKSVQAPNVGQPQESATAAANITPEEALALEARCTDNSIKPGIVKKYFAVALFSQMTSQQLADAHALIDSTLAQREAERQSAQTQG